MTNWEKYFGTPEKTERTLKSLKYTNAGVFILDNGKAIRIFRPLEWLYETEPIVRCRDCKHFIPNCECHFFDNSFIDEDGFCAWGERKE